MTAERIIFQILATPFRLFTLCLAVGRAIPVWSADCLSLDGEGRILWVYLPRSNETEIVDLLLVVSIRFQESDAAAVPATAS